MSIRVSRRAQKSALAIAGVMVSAVALSGCTALGSRAFGDPTVTGSTAQSSPGNINQPMPAGLGAPGMQTAEAQFLPPANVGYGAPTAYPAAQPGYMTPMAPMAGGSPTVSSQDLPVLNSSPMGSQQAMPAQQNLAPAAVTPRTAALGSLPTNLSTPTMVPVSPLATAAAAPAGGNVYKHTIAGGESLYTIARKYDVTTQSIVQANGMSSPDKIVVGQSIIIPGRADLLAKSAAPQVASAGNAPMPAQHTAGTLPAAPQLATAPKPLAAPVAAPVRVATAPAVAPQAAPASDKFRWPVSGRVITDFAASKATGINIEAAEGATVKAADNGTVIYVGSGVEGYGNLILIRHANGYVSAYAHLKSMSVAKGAVVGRGDPIGAAGMTGSVSKPQLHFELRKGATPVDPVPLLAG
ncbi:peptidoglycan DD-metalloendopeptidase family protein [Devosia sp.]|uniref:peptidoglycan DD-metalloendopeptidase family protein n=1 Tax=Devosia sp. TaxID=1871048 RepID=UPI00326341D4